MHKSWSQQQVFPYFTCISIKNKNEPWITCSFFFLQEFTWDLWFALHFLSPLCPSRGSCSCSWSVRRNTVFSPGSEGFSARSQLGGSPRASGSSPPTNRKEVQEDGSVYGTVDHSGGENENQLSSPKPDASLRHRHVRIYNILTSLQHESIYFWFAAEHFD